MSSASFAFWTKLLTLSKARYAQILKTRPEGLKHLKFVPLESLPFAKRGNPKNFVMSL